MFRLFMDCHGLANVNDKKSPCVVEEGVFIPEDTVSVSVQNHASPLEICAQPGLHS